MVFKPSENDLLDISHFSGVPCHLCLYGYFRSYLAYKSWNSIHGIGMYDITVIKEVQ